MKTQETFRTTRATHTPGPWELTELTEDHGAKHLAIRHVGQERRAVCLISGVSCVDALDVANAHLIAAAPDLLEAAKTALTCLRNMVSELEPMSTPFQDYFAGPKSPGAGAIRQLAEALAKAGCRELDIL